MSTQDERELLELAAKAAGIKLADEIDSHIPSGGVWVVGLDGRDKVWSPLKDDGDALRLAVRMEINILPCMEITEARNPSYTGWIKESNPGNPYAATRRAIVRAAAEIGRAS